MKNQIRKLLILLPIMVFFLLFLAIEKRQDRKKEYIKTHAILPNFDYYDLDSTKLYTRSQTKGKPFIMIYFDSQCFHCQTEVQGIIQDSSKIKNLTILLLSSESLKTLTDFKAVNKIHNLSIGKVDKTTMFNSFHTLTTPSTFVYDSKGRLLCYFDKMVTTNVILECIR